MADPALDRRDGARAIALREQLAAGIQSEWMSVSDLRAWFGGRRLTIERKAAIAESLTAADIEAFPPLEHLSARDTIRLRVVRRRRASFWTRFRSKLLTPVGRAITFLASVVGLTTVALAAFGAASTQFKAMTGDLNIAVVSFTTGTTATAEGAALAIDTAESLQSETAGLDHSLHIRVRSPATMTASERRQPIESLAAARHLAHVINADIVVYGQLETTLQSTRLVPAFYFNTKRLPWATSLGGRYGYGKAISTPYSIYVNPQARATIRSGLLARTRAYAEAFVGIGYAFHNAPVAAEHYLLAVADSPYDREILPLMDLLLGNIANQRRRPRRALDYYAAASHHLETVARAELGFADVTYALAQRGCAWRRAVISALTGARHRFARVASGSVSGYTEADDPSLHTKAIFGMAQVDLCLSAARAGNYWARSRSEFELVARSYASHAKQFPELQADAAEAHAGIALSDLALQAPPTSYKDARSEYENAFQLASIQARRAYFMGAVAYAEEGLGDYAVAAADYRMAAKLAASRRIARGYLARADRAEARR